MLGFPELSLCLLQALECVIAFNQLLFKLSFESSLLLVQLLDDVLKLVILVDVIIDGRLHLIDCARLVLVGLQERRALCAQSLVLSLEDAVILDGGSELLLVPLDVLIALEERALKSHEFILELMILGVFLH